MLQKSKKHPACRTLIYGNPIADQLRGGQWMWVKREGDMHWSPGNQRAVRGAMSGEKWSDATNAVAPVLRHSTIKKGRPCGPAFLRIVGAYTTTILEA